MIKFQLGTRISFIPPLKQVFEGKRHGVQPKVSNPKMKCQVFLCIFQKNSAMAIGYLRFEIGKFCPVGCLSLGKLNWDSQLDKTFSVPSQRNIPISIKLKVAIVKFAWKMQKKSGIIKSGLDAIPLFLLDDLLSFISE